MRTWLTILVFTLLLVPSEIQARGCLFFCAPSHESHHQVKRAYDPAFCQDIIRGFSELKTEELDKFVSSIPANKRVQAKRCLSKD